MQLRAGEAGVQGETDPRIQPEILRPQLETGGLGRRTRRYSGTRRLVNMRGKC